MNRSSFQFLALLGLIFFPASGRTQSSFFLEFNFDRGYTLCPTGTGNLFLAGMDGVDMVLVEIAPDGAVVSARYIDVGISGLDVPCELFVDSDGKLVVAGNLAEDSPANGFVFRYDPVLRQTLWAKTFGGGNTLTLGILENGPGGSFFVYGNPHDNSSDDDAELLQLDRNTGNVVPGSAWRYRFGSSDQFNSIVRDNDALYAAGRFTDGASFEKMRQALLKINPDNGAVEWARLGHVPSSGNARLYGRDILLEQDALVSVSSGDDSGADLNNSAVFLQKTDKDGNLIWARKFNFTEWSSEYAEEIVSLPDGYMVFGRTLSDAEGALFLLKTDKDGKLLWARKIRQNSGSRAVSAAQNQMIAIGDAVYVAGFSYDAFNSSRAFLLKTDRNGEIGDSCAVFVPTDVMVSDILNPANNAFSPVVDTSFTFVADLPVSPSVSFFPQRQVICQSIQDDCQILPDITYTIDSIVCGNGSMMMHYTVCNLGGAPVSSLITTFYAGNPTQAVATDLLIQSIFFTNPLQPGECLSRISTRPGSSWFPDGLTSAVDIYSVTNHEGGFWLTPFSLDSFPAAGLVECNYTNNLSSVTFQPAGPILDLGPDIVLCDDGTTATLDAGPGYYDYLWSTGDQTQTLFVTTPGVYWVEVTDECGIKQRDSLFFSYSLLPDTQFPDSVICPGENLVYALPGFDTYTWAPATGLSCSDCPVVTIQPDETTVYTVFATTVNGCVLTDTFTVTVLSDPAGVSLQCPSDIVVVADPGASSSPVVYNDPAVGSSCPCGGAAWTVTQGLASGADFPLGSTQVCIEAQDGCKGMSACCFTVTVEETPVADEPCDVKETPCIRFEILGIAQNPAGQKTYTMRVINKCPGELVSVAYQLPNGQNAIHPANGSLYTSPAGRQYTVRNPNATPFHSIRFSSIGQGIANGQSDIFEYTLPAQADPIFIRVRARLAPLFYYDAHLNVFACEVRKVQNRPEPGAADRNLPDFVAEDNLSVFPNPARQTLFVDLTAWEDSPVQIMIMNALGQDMLRLYTPGGSVCELELPAQWTSGLYHLVATTSNGARAAVRFVKTNTR